MKLIFLSKGKFAQVDDDIYDYLSQWKWYFDGKYARRHIKWEGKQQNILLHRVVNTTPQGLLTDHIDGDCLNNQRANLRNCTKRTNAANMRKHRGSSVYKGVSKHENSWRTQIWQNNEKVYGAVFPNERWAAMAYDLNAKALFGEYARLNFAGELVCLVLNDCAASPRSGG
jgi:hypothetical protein